MSGVGSRRARLELHDTSKVIGVRDYFARLGARATIRGNSAVDVEFPDGGRAGGDSIVDYVRSWSDANRVTVRMTAITAETPAAAPAPSPAPGPPPRLGQLLVTKGYISDEQLAAALVESRSAGEILGKTLIGNGYIFESELARTLAEQWGLPYVNLMSVGVDPDAAREVPRPVGERFGAIPVRKLSASIQVAFVDPSDEEAAAAIRQFIPSVSPVVADHSDIVMAWRSVRQ